MAPPATPLARWRTLSRRHGRAIAWLLWSATLVAVTMAMISVRGDLDQAHVALIYLLVVLGGSASGGRALGFSLACACFLLIDYYLQTPFDTLSVEKPLDWFVLLAFLATATVAAQLLGLATGQAEAARQRAEEIDRLAALGAETLSLARSEDALGAIAERIRQTVGGAECEIYAVDAEGRQAHEVASTLPVQGACQLPSVHELVAWVAEHRRVAAELADGSVLHLGAQLLTGAAAASGEAELAAATALLLPLLVHGRAVGVLRLADRVPLALDAPRRRFLVALAYYAALGVERMRLMAEAERAEALREADRLKDALLASVSHDLRTPLTTIKALAHDIAESGDERASVIEQQSDRLNHMVADLLDLSRLTAGGMPMQPEVNAAEDLVGAALQQVSGMLQGRELRTALEWTGPVPLGCFDFVHALRILVNLIENALKYSPQATPIEIAVSQEEAWLAISVADRGRGVPPAERERIFEPFYRPPGASPDAGSAGLGLAISRRLAAAQGGSLEYAERVGGGSVFTLRLPAVSLDEEAVVGERDLAR